MTREASSLHSHRLCLILVFLLAYRAGLPERAGGEERGLGSQVCREQGAWGGQGRSQGLGEMPEAEDARPGPRQAPHERPLGPAGRTRLGPQRGSRWGARSGGGRPHPCSREAGAAAVPQLLRRKLFRVTGAAVQRATAAGRGQERRARRVRGAGGGRWQLRGGPGDRAGYGAPRLLRSRPAGATCCSRWLSLATSGTPSHPAPAGPEPLLRSPPSRSPPAPAAEPRARALHELGCHPAGSPRVQPRRPFL